MFVQYAPQFNKMIELKLYWVWILFEKKHWTKIRLFSNILLSSNLFFTKNISRELKFSSEFFFCLNLLWVLQWDTVTGMQVKKVFRCYWINEQIEPFRFQSLVCTIWRFLCGLMKMSVLHLPAVSRLNK